MELNLFDVVVLTENIANPKLKRGSMGTIVEILDENDHVYLVEFSDSKGVGYAFEELIQSQLIKVYEQPIAA